MSFKSPQTLRGHTAPVARHPADSPPPLGTTHPPGLLVAAAAAGLTMLSVATSAHAGFVGVITDRSFFNAFSRTLINFETRGDGSPVQSAVSPGNPPLNGEAITMPAGEYASQGLLFQNPVSWVNDGNGFFDAAQLIGGSPIMSIPSANVDQFTIEFTVPVRGLGFFVAHNPLAQGSEPPSFVARDANNNVIGSVTWGAQFVDGTLGGGQAQYGFMGLQTDTLIKTVVISKKAAILDDLIFSPVPTPGAFGVMALASLVAANRRSRRNPADDDPHDVI